MLFALLLSLPGLSNALPGSFPSKIAAGTYFPSFDDKPIFYNEWIPSDKPIARVIAIPGLGDHIRRYSELFEHLNAHGIYVQGMDPRGFGETVRVNHEEKGYSRFKKLFKDLQEFEKKVGDCSLPTFLYGHSLGKSWFNSRWSRNTRIHPKVC